MARSLNLRPDPKLQTTRRKPQKPVYISQSKAQGIKTLNLIPENPQPS